MRTPDHVCERDRLMAAPITLNGQRARIAGRLEPYATVWAPDDLATGVEFAWKTVQHVIDNCGGRFKA